jgi:hypothetical protein
MIAFAISLFLGGNFEKKKSTKHTYIEYNFQNLVDTKLRGNTADQLDLRLR